MNPKTENARKVDVKKDIKGKSVKSEVFNVKKDIKGKNVKSEVFNENVDIVCSMMMCYRNNLLHFKL